MVTNHYKHPYRGLASKVADLLANYETLAKIRRATIGKLPFVILASDVRDVTYATWLVSADRARRWVPPGAALIEADGLTPFTILTYRHGHYGPRVAGPLRRMFPSPLQSNWRFYLQQSMVGAPDCNTVLFVKNVFNSTIYAIGSRVCSDALPAHRASEFEFIADASGIAISIEPGDGSAPSFTARFNRRGVSQYPPAFSSFASDWDSIVTLLAKQEAAVVWVPRIDKVAVATISLPIDVGAVEPLELEEETLDCPLLQGLEPRGRPLCFWLPSVHFQAISEQLL